MPDLRRIGHLAVGTALTSRAGTRFHLLLDRLSAGRLFGSVRGLRTVVLTTTGRRSGRRVEAPLSALEDAGGWVVAASNGGRDHPPAWLLNLRADPRAELRVNGRPTSAKALALHLAGTGLGRGGYAVVGQGEGGAGLESPEAQLLAHLEEAAGLRQIGRAHV